MKGARPNCDILVGRVVRATILMTYAVFYIDFSSLWSDLIVSDFIAGQFQTRQCSFWCLYRFLDEINNKYLNNQKGIQSVAW